MPANTKPWSALWAVVLTVLVWGAVGSLPARAQAPKPPAVTHTMSPEDQDISVIDAQRGALDRFLDTHPEIANDVSGNPHNMSDPSYLRDHQELQAFLESHPQVKADPRAFISPREWRVDRTPSGFNDLLSNLPPVLAFACFLLGATWIIRAFLENRRWTRAFKMHEDVHTKLIEKFASGQDFSAYLQSDAGRRLLEWAPPALGTTSRGLPHPAGRILGSLQAGVVLFVVGLGLLVLRGHMEASDAPPLLVFGTLGLTLGAGFVLSALLSYGLSKRLGLLGEPVHASDAKS